MSSGLFLQSSKLIAGDNKINSHEKYLLVKKESLLKDLVFSKCNKIKGKRDNSYHWISKNVCTCRSCKYFSQNA